MEEASEQIESRPAGRRRFRLRTAIVGVAVVAAVASLVTIAALEGGDGSDAAATPTATATVARRDLVQRSTVPGTLGYADPRTVVSQRGGTITSAPEAGSVLRPGSVLYRVDERPVVLYDGRQPAWRPLGLGVGDGDDVRQLEQNLRALGYDDRGELTVDRHFSSETAAVVARWQAAVGLPASGRVELGDVVFLRGARRTGSVRVSLGDRVRPGMPVLTSSSTARLITAAIDAGDQGDIAVGDAVTVDLYDGTATAGRISDVDRVAVVAVDPSTGTGADLSTTIGFEVLLDDPSAAGRLEQAPVEIGVTSELAKDALSVPVTALLALRGGRYGLEVVRGGTTQVVSVKPGLYSDGGYVEVERGRVKAGDLVVVAA